MSIYLALNFMNFNPRSPYGERPSKYPGSNSIPIFQSTLPLRGATNCSSVRTDSLLFQSTLPLRGATPQGDSPARIDEISIHAPLTGSDHHTVDQKK